MRKETRTQFNTYLAGVAHDNQLELSGVVAGQKFTVEPSVQQKLEKKVQESSAFLGLINVVPVTEAQGQTLGLGVASTIASTTDTTQTGRKTQDLHNLSAIAYHCQQINYDTHYCLATANLYERYRSYDSTKDGADKADDFEQTVDELRRDARFTVLPSHCLISSSRCCNGLISLIKNTLPAFSTSPKPPTLLGIIPISCGGTRWAARISSRLVFLMFKNSSFATTSESGIT